MATVFQVLVQDVENIRCILIANEKVMKKARAYCEQKGGIYSTICDDVSKKPFSSGEEDSKKMVLAFLEEYIWPCRLLITGHDELPEFLQWVTDLMSPEEIKKLLILSKHLIKELEGVARVGRWSEKTRMITPEQFKKTVTQEMKDRPQCTLL